MGWKTLYLSNDNRLVVDGVKNESTGEYINDATVEVTLLDEDGDELAGQSWPLALDYITGTNGDYDGTLQDTLVASDGDIGTMLITVDGDGLQAELEFSYVFRTRANVPQSITDLDTIKAILGITGTDDDAQLEILRSIAESTILSQSAFVLCTTSFTEFYSGNGSRILGLRRLPVQSITNLWLDSDGYFGQGAGAFSDDDLLVQGTDYALRVDQGDGGAVTSRSGLVHRIGAVWPNASLERPGMLTYGPGDPIGNIKVQYLAGFESVPAYVIGAIAQMVAQLQAQSESQGFVLASESFDYYSYSKGGADMVKNSLTSVQSMLSPILKSAQFLI